MVLKIKHIVIFITIVLYSCQEERQVLIQIKGVEQQINDSLPTSETIAAYIAPFQKHLNAVLDSTLTYAPYIISKKDGVFNTPAGNLMADIVMREANPIFRRRSGQNIDFVLLNHGGIRSDISKGMVSARTAYEVMPFENQIVVVELNGKSIRELVRFLINSDQPHPISGIQVILDNKNKLQSVNIHGIPFDENRTYHVATSDYLLNGGDAMGFFKESLKTMNLNYLIRNAMIDYFGSVDTLRPVTDNRFLKLK